MIISDVGCLVFFLYYFISTDDVYCFPYMIHPHMIDVCFFYYLIFYQMMMCIFFPILYGIDILFVLFPLYDPHIYVLCAFCFIIYVSIH